MTWYVKWRKAADSVASILCDERKKVAELYDEQDTMGRSVWIEDHEGKPLQRSDFDNA